MIEIQSTSEYPLRYKAFDNPGILFVNVNPKKMGGCEWAVFDSKKMHLQVISYQDKYLTVSAYNYSPPIPMETPEYLKIIPFCDFGSKINELIKFIEKQ